MPPQPDLNRGRRKTGEAAIQARAETVAEAKRRTEEYAVRVRVPKRLRCLARIILPGAPIALQISPSLSSQVSGARISRCKTDVDTFRIWNKTRFVVEQRSPVNLPRSCVLVQENSLRSMLRYRMKMALQLILRRHLLALPTLE